MGLRGRTTMNLMVGLVATTFATSLLELLVARYASSVTLAADALHMLLDGFVYTLNLIAEHKAQKFERARATRMAFEKTRSPSPLSPIPESDNLLGASSTVEVCELLSPRIIEADAEEASMAASASRWQSASALTTGVVLLGSAITVGLASIMKLTYAAAGSRQASELDGDMDVNFVFLTGLLSACVHTGALLMFFCHPELKHLHHTPTLCFASSPGTRRGSRYRVHYRHGDIHLSATLFHIISDILENVGLLVVVILVRLKYHPAIVDAAASVAISGAILVVSASLLVKAVPAFNDAFCKKTLSEALHISPTFAKSYRRQRRSRHNFLSDSCDV
uniref:Cation efflux protein transmembrane domain-containing protein n=2 Tax=Lotharella globosa TaxID=91324 RepID=A0A7S3YEX8_9EUKA|mmetsp:Transcript_22492/g.45158  ORF Transcript_22492/g.45158 Transcript_22492/m.45158 type:complete len:335 (+) Transcript_22492:87-1091(+)